MLNARGRSAKVEGIVPYTWLSGDALLNGEPIEREVTGFAEPRFGASINLYVAPALTVREFAGRQQDLIIGASLQVRPPAGQYDPDRVVNLSTNRWTFTPEVGLSKALGSWIVEFAAAASFFTDNDDFLNGGTREQDPIYSLQSHLIHSFGRGIWAALDINYFTGGRTAIDGVRGDDLQRSWRVGGHAGRPDRPAPVGQALRQQRRLGPHREQLRRRRRRPAVALGRRALKGSTAGVSRRKAGARRSGATGPD